MNSPTDGIRTEVTHSWYDDVDANIGAGLPGYLSQTHLRKRIAHVTYEDTLDTDTTTYDHATHYSYDIHGNVNTLVQDNQKLLTVDSSLMTQRFKRMDYNYDLISGNVHSVSYQKDSADAWHHAYEYDADNRITNVYTSNAVTAMDEAHRVESSSLWDKDAKYEYYLHGPLSRMETGDLQVQGTDYAYTLQGWIKGVNSNTLDTIRDIGKDGWRDSSNVNMNFPKDVYSYSLNYFTNDYAAIDPAVTGTDHFLADLTGSDILANRYNLFNGNIGSMITTITDPTTRDVLPLGNAYKYDQLNRLLEARSFTNIDIPNNEWDFAGSYSNKYFNKFSYDANGNMLTARAQDESSGYLDFQTYNYQTIGGRKINNRLYAIQDTAVDNSKYGLSDQLNFDNTASTINTANNYRYDELGNLKYNKQDSIIAVVWTVFNKPKEIYRMAGCSKKNAKFDYDAMHNRIAKHIYNSDSTWVYSEFYSKDAQGNIMTTYKHTYDDVEEEVSYQATEQHIYGSSSLGQRKDTLEMIGAVVDTSEFVRILGKKNYSLSNHLHNVLSVISDKKLPLDWDTDDTVDSYQAEILTAQDYAPFGGDMKGRDFSSSDFPNSFNGKRDDEELGDWQDYGMRTYMKNARRFVSVDPLLFDFPWNSTYAFAENRVVEGIDLEGAEFYNQTARVGYETEGMGPQFKTVFSSNIYIRIDRQTYNITKTIMYNYVEMAIGYRKERIYEEDIKFYNAKLDSGDDSWSYQSKLDSPPGQYDPITSKNYTRGTAFLFLIDLVGANLQSKLLEDLATTKEHLNKLATSHEIVNIAAKFENIPDHLKTVEGQVALTNYILDTQLPSTDDAQFNQDVVAYGKWMFENRKEILNGDVTDYSAGAVSSGVTTGTTTEIIESAGDNVGIVGAAAAVGAAIGNNSSSEKETPEKK